MSQPTVLNPVFGSRKWFSACSFCYCWSAESDVVNFGTF